ncbi:hypothetical protein FHW36_102640 [Chitinophaga polysaccharea]|uniref:Uncharacterized protein n=1 Tax=Chitinophaga polysaccharea TaxID=1293035 RepID=A0A561PXQ0_9BACT|nr:DUF6755 family protein [Chitinophaga polysaccharea]TWF42879.1 hypothetical protein FHW36_102640 [Chitinophaga polysaccharea]
MSNFKDAQNKAHPNKTNTLISALIIILILNISLQIWLLYTGLNNALGDNRDIALPAFIASLVLFLIGFFWLYFLPMGYKKSREK